MTAAGPGRASQRHPAARARAAHLTEMGAAVARRGAGMSGPHRSVAAAALAVRGVQWRSVTTFASAYGVEAKVVEELEAGLIGPDQIPAPLSLLTPVRDLARAVADRCETDRSGAVLASRSGGSETPAAGGAPGWPDQPPASSST